MPEDVTYDLKLESSCFAANTILNIERNAELSRTAVRLFVVLFIQCSLRHTKKTTKCFVPMIEHSGLSTIYAHNCSVQEMDKTPVVAVK